MHSREKSGVKNIIMQRLDKSCDQGTRLEQHDCSIAERSERLLSLTVILTRTQPHVNGNSSGVFILISHGNGLIGFQSFSE